VHPIAPQQFVGRERNQRACHRQLVRNVLVARASTQPLGRSEGCREVFGPEADDLVMTTSAVAARSALGAYLSHCVRIPYRAGSARAKPGFECPRRPFGQDDGALGDDWHDQQKAGYADIDVDWVLKREYIRIHEVSRDKDASSGIGYEAWIYSSGTREGRVRGNVLDNTAATNFAAEGIATRSRTATGSCLS